MIFDETQGAGLSYFLENDGWSVSLGAWAKSHYMKAVKRLSAVGVDDLPPTQPQLDAVCEGLTDGAIKTVVSTLNYLFYFTGAPGSVRRLGTTPLERRRVIYDSSRRSPVRSPHPDSIKAIQKAIDEGLRLEEAVVMSRLPYSTAAVFYSDLQKLEPTVEEPPVVDVQVESDRVRFELNDELIRHAVKQILADSQEWRQMQAAFQQVLHCAKNPVSAGLDDSQAERIANIAAGKAFAMVGEMFRGRS